MRDVGFRPRTRIKSGKILTVDGQYFAPPKRSRAKLHTADEAPLCARNLPPSGLNIGRNGRFGCDASEATGSQKTNYALFGRTSLNIELGETEGRSGSGARKTGRRLLNMRAKTSQKRCKILSTNSPRVRVLGEAESGPAATPGFSCAAQSSSSANGSCAAPTSANANCLHTGMPFFPTLRNLNCNRSLPKHVLTRKRRAGRPSPFLRSMMTPGRAPRHGLATARA